MSSNNQGMNNKPTHIKRPLNVFMVWSNIERKRLYGLNPNKHNAEISQELGIRWKQLTKEEKAPFQAEADRLKALHLQQNPDYKYQPRKKRKLNAEPNTDAAAGILISQKKAEESDRQKAPLVAHQRIPFHSSNYGFPNGYPYGFQQQPFQPSNGGFSSGTPNLIPFAQGIASQFPAPTISGNANAPGPTSWRPMALPVNVMPNNSSQTSSGFNLNPIPKTPFHQSYAPDSVRTLSTGSSDSGFSTSSDSLPSFPSVPVNPYGPPSGAVTMMKSPIMSSGSSTTPNFASKPQSVMTQLNTKSTSSVPSEAIIPFDTPVDISEINPTIGISSDFQWMELLNMLKTEEFQKEEFEIFFKSQYI